MSSTRIPDKVKQVLFGRAAGRCEYRGCNRLLSEDHLTRRQGKFGVFAHIVADEPGGPRGDVVLSKRLSKDIDNVMLLCLEHHRLVDVDDVEGHSVEVLRRFKTEHEQRVRDLTEIQGEHRTVVVVMGANIGGRKGVISRAEVLEAVHPRYPTAESVEIDMTRLFVSDGDPLVWQVGVREIDGRAAQLQDLLVRVGVAHISVFALAPIPLLMVLGRALGDIVAGEPHQRRRDPPGWTWLPPTGEEQEFVVRERGQAGDGTAVALMISVSGEIDFERVLSVTSPGTSAIELRVPEPMTDIVRTQSQVRAFRRAVRRALAVIVRRFGSGATVHVFPALPNSLAVAFGQALLPKVDPRIVVYDRNSDRGGWVQALELVPGT